MGCDGSALLAGILILRKSLNLQYDRSIFVSFVSLWFVPPPRQEECILEYILPTKSKRAQNCYNMWLDRILEVIQP